MSFQEGRALMGLAVTVVAYTLYVVVVMSRADGGPLTDVAYQGPLLWTIGGAILATILLHILMSIAWREGANETDQRDREIGRFSSFVAQGLVVIGAVSALLLAMVEADWFWIANVVYLCFVLSAVLEAITRVAAYRWGFQQW